MAKPVSTFQLAWEKPEAPVAIVNGCPVSHQLFLSQALKLASSLPDNFQYAINLCENRFHFLITFTALLIKNITSILPASKAQHSIIELADEFSSCMIIGDKPNRFNDLMFINMSSLAIDSTVQESSLDKVSIDPGLLAVIAFTSGSTGRAKANYKYWWQLEASTRQALQRFELLSQPPAVLIVTVPPQHMYGLETSIFYPLLGNNILFSGNTFFPEDLRLSIESAPAPCILITTPVHLKSCIQSRLKWSKLELIISATAPLDKNIARQAEESFNCPVMEIFGSTETGAIASRRTVKDAYWRLYNGVEIRPHNKQYRAEIKGPQHKDWMPLSDSVEIIDQQHFNLLGRHSDMVKIAGKRASLADLTIKLNSIQGVQDGILFQDPRQASETSRLIALVVAPQLSSQHITQALYQDVDPVFLPRPIIKVEQLPRNETGKIKKQDILNIYYQKVHHASK
jgi:acyl-coenzyme A synthetase/AMP-(fatty) acid ligase